MIMPKECLRCKHFIGPIGKGEEVVETCKAFPKEIPNGIIRYGGHRTVRKGQVGDFVFEEIK